uniref:Uncharacterized protein n=1 Tax=Trichogramma kaykai TaxID=54128 RepID=A0ABD2WK49_9HYME
MFTFDQKSDGINLSTGEIDRRDEFQCAYQQQLDKLKSLRENSNLENDTERLVFLRELDALICDWDGSQPLDLHRVFSNRDMDYLLKLPRFVDTELTGRELIGNRLIDFFIRAGYKDEPDYDEQGKPVLRRSTPIHHWAMKEYFPNGFVKVFDLFNIYDKYWANYVDDSGLTHFHVACLYGHVKEVTRFLEAGVDVNCPGYSRGESPLYCSLLRGHLRVARLLLAKGADPNASNVDGATPLHVVCMGKYQGYCQLVKWLIEASQQLNKPLLMNVRDKRGNTPLHSALNTGFAMRIELLLKHGADLHLPNDELYTPLHGICKQNLDGRAGESLLRVCGEKLETLHCVDLRDKYDNTPLHLALRHGNLKMAEMLLRHGADLHLPNDELYTPLHGICKQKLDGRAGESLLRVCGEKLETLHCVDLRDKYDNTPLHLALRHGNSKMAEMLLRRGADPNAVNIGRFTPLHIVCKRERDDVDSLELVFRICEEKQMRVQIDAVDMLNRTPLQWAVANLMPDVVDALLDRGADPSAFVFPTSSYFAANRRVVGPSFKFRQAADALAIAKSLKKRGYELMRSDATTIMELFARHELFKSAVNLDTLWQDDEEFTSKAKTIEITEEGLSLYDLLKLPAEETARNHALYRDRLIRLGRSEALAALPVLPTEVCVKNLCEIMATGFFRDWALDPFWELINYRLPVLCCRMIVENLSNQDLYNICLAVEWGQQRAA